MFNAKSKSQNEGSVQTSASIIANGTTFKGDITSTGDIRIDGSVQGNIQCSAKIVIGANGNVDGDINGQQADIMGHVKGTVRVKDLLQLKGNCHVEGNLHAAKLQVEPTAKFNGQCHVSGGDYKAGEVKMSPNGHPKSSAAA